jgi:hypothetical protein
MGCGCGKKTGSGLSQMMGAQRQGVAALEPVVVEDWGPILWKYLHCLAEKIGRSGSTIVDTDQANYMETILTTLHLVIPCTMCQAHANVYITVNPIPPLRGLYGENLRDTIRTWLFKFHNAVRASKQQEIIVSTTEECSALYSNCLLAKCDYNIFIQNVASAVRQGWVRIEHWRKWYSNSERLRIILGNIVV